MDCQKLNIINCIIKLTKEKSVFKKFTHKNVWNKQIILSILFLENLIWLLTDYLFDILYDIEIKIYKYNHEIGNPTLLATRV